MGLVSLAPKVWNYTKRIANVYPELVFGTGSEVIGNTLKTTKGSVWTKGKAGFKALEKSVKEQSVNGGFFKRLWTNLKSTPSAIKISAKDGYKAAKAAGKSGIWGGTKGLFKGIGKKLPFIGSALMVLFEIPNIITATKEQGIGQGVKETAKSAARLGGAAVGAAIGTAVCPVIGSLIGWVAGEWLTSKVVGKSYSEKKMEAEEQAAEQIAQIQAQQQNQYQQPSFTGNPYEGTATGMYNPMNAYNSYSTPYADDIMMQNMNFNTIA